MSENLERRRFPRYHCSGVSEILQCRRPLGWGKVSDISRSGCYIETVQPLPAGTEVQLRLTIADLLLVIGAKVVTTTPLVGMGMDFLVALAEQESKLAQIVEKVAAINASPALQEAARPQPLSAALQITREAAPDILDVILERVYENGVLTSQEIDDIVKASRAGYNVYQPPASIDHKRVAK